MEEGKSHGESPMGSGDSPCVRPTIPQKREKEKTPEHERDGGPQQWNPCLGGATSQRPSSEARRKRRLSSKRERETAIAETPCHRPSSMQDWAREYRCHLKATRQRLTPKVRRKPRSYTPTTIVGGEVQAKEVPANDYRRRQGEIEVETSNVH